MLNDGLDAIHSAKDSDTLNDVDSKLRRGIFTAGGATPSAALTAPTPHNFSTKAWLSHNPGGNGQAAAAEAKKTGIHGNRLMPKTQIDLSGGFMDEGAKPAPSAPMDLSAGFMDQPQATTPSSTPDKDTSSFGHGLYESTVGPLVGMAQAARQAELNNNPASFAPAVVKGAVQSQFSPFKRGVQEVSDAIHTHDAGIIPRLSSAYLGLGDMASSLLPGIGPMVSKAGQDFGENKGSEAVGETLGALGTGVLFPKMGEGIAAKAAKYAAKNEVIPGQNFTPQQAADHAGIIARGTGGGKGYIPQDLANAITGHVRQAAADNPEIANVITKGDNPTDALGAYQALLDRASTPIDNLHDQVLNSVRNQPFDPSAMQASIRSSFPSTLRSFDPATASEHRRPCKSFRQYSDDGCGK